MKHIPNPLIALDGPTTSMPEFPEHLTFPWPKQSPDYSYAADVHMAAVNSRQNLYEYDLQYETRPEFQDPFQSYNRAETQNQTQHQTQHSQQQSQTQHQSHSHSLTQRQSHSESHLNSPSQSQLNSQGQSHLNSHTQFSYPDNGLSDLNSSGIAGISVSGSLGVNTTALAHTNDMMSAGYFDTHAVAATIAEMSASTEQKHDLDFGLLHRRSFPDVGTARAGPSGGYYDLFQRYLLPHNLAYVQAPPQLLPSNYTLGMRRSSSGELSNNLPAKTAVKHTLKSQRHESHRGHEGLSPHYHVNDDLLPQLSMSAKERWESHTKRFGRVQEPQEAMICAHCEERFDDILEYLEHLDMEKVKHENFCPDQTCAFAVVGFRFRWLLRRHICNHHLKQYNSDSAKKHDQMLEKLLKEFLGHVYVCTQPKCLRAFYRLDSLQRHQRLIHGPDRKRYRKVKMLMDKTEEEMFV